MIPPTTFTRFPDLAPELQVIIINHALEKAMAQRGNRLDLYIHPNAEHVYPPPIVCHPVRLPKLPSIYHTNRLFRHEALRIQPLHRIFTDDEPTTLHACGSMVVFNPAQNTLILHADGHSSSNAPVNLSSLFVKMKSVRQTRGLGCLFAIVGTKGSAAVEGAWMLVWGYAHRILNSGCVQTVNVGGKVRIWQIVKGNDLGGNRDGVEIESE